MARNLDGIKKLNSVDIKKSRKIVLDYIGEKDQAKVSNQKNLTQAVASLRRVDGVKLNRTGGLATAKKIKLKKPSVKNDSPAIEAIEPVKSVLAPTRPSVLSDHTADEPVTTKAEKKEESVKSRAGEDERLKEAIKRQEEERKKIKEEERQYQMKKEQAERIIREQAEKFRQEKIRLEKERADREKAKQKEKERVEQAKRWAEKIRLEEAEKEEKRKAEEKRRLEKMKIKEERKEEKRKIREDRRLARLKRKAERRKIKEAIKTARLAERLKREEAENQRREKIRLEQEKLKKERLAKETEERKTREQAAAKRIEEETQRREKIRLEQEKLKQDRLAKEEEARKIREQAEAKRREAEEAAKREKIKQAEIEREKKEQAEKKLREERELFRQEELRKKAIADKARREAEEIKRKAEAEQREEKRRLRELKKAEERKIKENLRLERIKRQAEIKKIKLEEKLARQARRAKQKIKRQRAWKKFRKNFNLKLGGFFSSIKKNVVYIISFLALFLVTAYVVFCFAVLRLNLGVAVNLEAKYLRVPAVITNRGVISYDDYKKIADNNYLSLSLAEKKKYLVKCLVTSHLKEDYGLPVNNSDNELAIKYVLDESYNQVGLSRINKINELLKGQSDIAAFGKYADEYNDGVYYSAEGATEKFGSTVSGLAVGQISNIMTRADGYYIVERIENKNSQLGFKYLFVEAQTIDQYVAKKLENIKVFILAN